MWAFMELISTPSNFTDPVVLGGVRPMMLLIRVLFPMPFLPRMPIISPFDSSNETP